MLLFLQYDNAMPVLNISQTDGSSTEVTEIGLIFEEDQGTLNTAEPRPSNKESSLLEEQQPYNYVGKLCIMKTDYYLKLYIRDPDFFLQTILFHVK